MDQDMEADEFFPDKVMSEPDSVEEGTNVSSIDNIGKQGGDSALNGEEVAEDMDTDEPPSVLGEAMETAEEDVVEPVNDLKELVKDIDTEDIVNTVEETPGKDENETIAVGTKTSVATEDVDRENVVEDRRELNLDNKEVEDKDDDGFDDNLNLEEENVDEQENVAINEGVTVDKSEDDNDDLDLDEPLGKNKIGDNDKEPEIYGIENQEENSTDASYKEDTENLGVQNITGVNSEVDEEKKNEHIFTDDENSQLQDDVESTNTKEGTESESEISRFKADFENTNIEESESSAVQVEDIVAGEVDEEKEVIQDEASTENMENLSTADTGNEKEETNEEKCLVHESSENQGSVEERESVETEEQDKNNSGNKKDKETTRENTENNRVDNTESYEVTETEAAVIRDDENEKQAEFEEAEISENTDAVTQEVEKETSQTQVSQSAKGDEMETEPATFSEDTEAIVSDGSEVFKELDTVADTEASGDALDSTQETGVESKDDEVEGDKLEGGLKSTSEDRGVEGVVDISEKRDESEVNEDNALEQLVPDTNDKGEEMDVESSVEESIKGESETMEGESEKTDVRVTEELGDENKTEEDATEQKLNDQSMGETSEETMADTEMSASMSGTDTAEAFHLEQSSSPTSVEKSSTPESESISGEKSEAVDQPEVEPSGDSISQSEGVSQPEATPSGDNSNQSYESDGRKSLDFDMSSVKIKKERVDSTESDKANENDNSGISHMKIVGVTSAVGVEDKTDNSEPASAKGDDDMKKMVIGNAESDEVKINAGEAAEKEAFKKKVNEGLRKKIKQENKVKEEEDDVIAIKEEKKPVQKPKPSKIQTCIVCGKVGKCKYNIVRNGDVKHLCDDNCFKRFRSNPTTYLKQAESATQNQTKLENQSNSKPAPAAIKTAAPVKPAQNQQPSFQAQSQVYKTCTVCQLMNVRTSKPFLNWQGLDFCGEECLGKYQGALSNNCSYCSGAIFPNNKAKNCCRVGNEVKHFCSANCNVDYVKRMKLCAFCSKDLAQSTDSFMAPVGETFKDFCSQQCLQKFEDKNNQDLEIVGVQKGQKVTKVTKGNFICAVCGKVGPIKHEFRLDSKVNRLCSDPCFSAFQYANKLTLNTCDNCGTNLNPEHQAPQYVQFEGQQRRFCSFMCVNSFRNSNKKTVPCAWCGNKKSNFDMIERVDANNKYQLFCSLNCLSLYRVNLQATSNQAVTCDQCRKFVPAQYHLTMSDASVRNFCSYGCVMQFQAQFQTPAKQVMQQSSVNSAAGIGRGQAPVQQQTQQKLQQQQQQQTTTRSGRVVTKATKVADMLQVAKSKGVKKDADSFPIISNVVSLAPQGTQHGQQQINIKSSTPVTVTNQQQGIKATTTTTTGSSGSQTVQQQIIIQPPPPKVMKNKSLLCKPFTQTKATSCRPHTQTKEIQTEGKIDPEKYLIPVPVPVYCPTPLAMYSMPTPILVPVPVPIPVPVFIPTTKKNANSILKQIKEIREKIPADPLEAELLMMAEAVAEKDDESSSSSEEEDNAAPPTKESSTAAAPASGGELGEDMLQMALRMASEMSDEPVMDLENSLEPVAVNTEPPPPPKSIIETPQPVEEEEEEYIPTSARSRRSRGGNKRQSRGTPRRNPKRQKVEVTPQYREATPSPPAPVAPPPDANFHLKYTYGVNAFKHWVIQKNGQIEQALKPGHGKSLRTFKTDILQCTADELNYSLCLFVKEVRKPNGEEYAVDSIYYLCLGIQQYLFENGRIDNIFTDFYYERFTEQLNEILTRYEPKLNHAGQLVCRIEEEHLWESKQLGAHSPHVLLNSLVYFNTKYFMLKTSEDHLKLSFTHIMKHWKKTATGRGSGTGPNAGRSVYLRYYCPTPQGKDNQKKKKEEMPVYEQTENLDNPLRCPVKLYEFYLSKCPESIKSRNDMFYLKPESSSVPDSPVWYSNQSINIEHLTKLLNRIRLVREIQEAHLHTRPIYI